MAAWRGAISRVRSRLVLVSNPNPNPNPNLSNPYQYVSSRGIASKLFVAGLSFYATEDSLSEAFSRFGQVVEAKIVMDRVSDRSKGFGFVTFASKEEADKAVLEMNGKILNGRTVFVDHAKPKPSFTESLPIARPPPEPLRNRRFSLDDKCNSTDK